MALAGGVLWDSGFWSGVAQWLMILFGLLIAARLVALTVSASVVWNHQPWHWRSVAWTGFVLVLAASAAWSLDDLAGDLSRAARDAGNVMLVLCAAVAAALFLAVLHQRAFPLPGRRAVWLGAAVLLTASFAVGLVTAAPVRGYVATGAVSAAGALLFGFALGTRLQLRVTVRADGQDSPSWAAFVATRMTTTSERARGLKAPEGTDVALPQDAVAALPTEGRTAVALIRLALSLFSVAPWRAAVVLAEDQRTATVELGRNGRSAASTIIYRSELGLNGFEPPPGAPDFRTVCRQDVLTAAGAFLFMRLRDAHPALDAGLCGASHWQSLACQILAGTPPWVDSAEAREQLYATAVAKDPGNDAAWLGYLYTHFTSAGPAGQQDLYIAKLRTLRAEIAGKGGDYTALRVRCAVNLVLAELNRCLEPSVDEAVRQEAERDVRSVLVELDALTGAPSGRGGEGAAVAGPAGPELDAVPVETRDAGGGLSPDLVAQARPVIEIVRAALDRRLPGEYRVPRSNYDAACAIAEGQDPDRVALAVERLCLAAGDRYLRGAIRQDPSFRELWDRSGARLAAITDRWRITDIRILGPYAARLEAAGIRYPEQLLERAGLEETLGLGGGAVAWLKGICLLATRCPQPRNAVPWTDLLTAEGVDSLDRLRDAEHDPLLLERLTSRRPGGAPRLTTEVLAQWSHAAPRTEPYIVLCGPDGSTPHRV